MGSNPIHSNVVTQLVRVIECLRRFESCTEYASVRQVVKSTD
ncbi:MAG TPA: hypothetical protein VFQ56_03555 [Flavobacterium sp.]|nr:hypothetical protein [Flavobacterium sp.]